jgi:predicted MPP superfamily phosphohydrolase
LTLVCIVIALIIIWIILSNVTIGTTHYNISSDRIPSSFEEYKIVQVSDLHNAVFGKANDRLLKKIQSEQSDVIFLTGDLIDSNHTDVDAALEFTDAVSKIAPCYFITGNHEAWISRTEYESMEQKLIEQGIVVLHNSSVDIFREGDSISLFGVDDPSFAGAESSIQSGIVISKLLEDVNQTKNYSILLSHRPEAFDYYAASGFNLVFCGHAHGGQFRLPFIGGIVAPDQGFFPKYDAGTYTENNMTMIVSRGLGNSIISVRINNCPEIVAVTLHHG